MRPTRASTSAPVFGASTILCRRICQIQSFDDVPLIDSRYANDRIDFRYSATRLSVTSRRSRTRHRVIDPAISGHLVLARSVRVRVELLSPVSLGALAGWGRLWVGLGQSSSRMTGRLG